MPFAVTWVDLEIIMLSEVCHIEKKYHLISLTYGIQKKDTNELIYKAEIDSQIQKTVLWLPKRKIGRRAKLGV